MEPYLAPILWAFFFALPCVLAGVLGASLGASKLRTPFGRSGRWAVAFRVTAFFLLAVMAFGVLLIGCVFVPMRLGL